MAISERQQIKVIFDQVNNFTERAVKKLVLDIVANLQVATPVDTGWARANWIPGIGGASNSPAPRPPGGAGTSSAANRQASAIASIATSYSLSQGEVFIVNNVPYILRLNEGSSRQAPSGFVQRAITKAVKQDITGLRQRRT